MFEVSWKQWKACAGIGNASRLNLSATPRRRRPSARGFRSSRSFRKPIRVYRSRRCRAGLARRIRGFRTRCGGRNRGGYPCDGFLSLFSSRPFARGHLPFPGVQQHRPSRRERLLGQQWRPRTQGNGERARVAVLVRSLPKTPVLGRERESLRSQSRTCLKSLKVILKSDLREFSSANRAPRQLQKESPAGGTAGL